MAFKVPPDTAPAGVAVARSVLVAVVAGTVVVDVDAGVDVNTVEDVAGVVAGGAEDVVVIELVVVVTGGVVEEVPPQLLKITRLTVSIARIIKNNLFTPISSFHKYRLLSCNQVTSIFPG